MPLPTDPLSGFAEWQQVLIIVAFAVILAHVLRTLISSWVRRSERLTTTQLDRMLLEELDYPLYLTLILGAIYVTFPLYAPDRLVFLVGGALITVILVAWTRAGIRAGSRTVTILEDSEHELEFAPVLKNLWSFFLLLGAFFVLLGIWEIDITPLLASAGVLGIIVGIAARDSIGNLLGGLSLHLDKTFEMGDMIQLDDGTRGTVTALSIRSTTILTPDNIAITIPNAELNRTRVINESAPVRRRRIRVDVGIGYDADLDLVEETLLERAAAEPLVLETPEPTVRFQGFGDSAIEVQLHCFIDHPAMLVRVRHRLIRAITEAFREAGIKIPLPQRELSFFESGNAVRVLDGETEGASGRVDGGEPPA